MEKPYDLASASSYLFDAMWRIDDALSTAIFSADDIKSLRTVQRELLDLVKVIDQIRNDNFKATIG